MESIGDIMNKLVKQSPGADSLQICANYLNEEVNKYGHDTFSKDYKNLLFRLSKPDIELRNNYRQLLKPRANKKYGLNEQTTNIIKLISWIHIINATTPKTIYFPNKTATSDETIDKNFKLLNGVLRIYERGETLKLNPLQEAAMVAKFSSTTEDFNQYCNELEILKSIIKSLPDLFFLHNKNLRKKVIMEIAPKYGYYPDLIPEENHNQFSYNEITKEQSKELFKDSFEIKRLADIINDTKNDRTNPITIYHITTQNFNNLISWGFLAFGGDEDEELKNIKIRIATELISNKKFSRNAISFLENMINRHRYPFITSLIIKNIQKFNNPECIKMLYNPNGNRIMHILIASKENLNSKVHLRITPDLYYSIFGKESAKKMIDAVWNKLKLNDKESTVRSFLYNIGIDNKSYKKLSKTTRDRIIFNLESTKSIWETTPSEKSGINITIFESMSDSVKNDIIEKITNDPELQFNIGNIDAEPQSNILSMLEHLNKNYQLNQKQSTKIEQVDTNEVIR